MKLAFLCFGCDHVLDGGSECIEESPAYTTWAEARAGAKRMGWTLGKGGAALCPDHRVIPLEDPTGVLDASPSNVSADPND